MGAESDVGRAGAGRGASGRDCRSVAGHPGRRLEPRPSGRRRAQGRLDVRSRQPEPLRRLGLGIVRGVVAQLRPARRLGPGGLQRRRLRARHQLGGLAGRQDLHLPPARRGALAGRGAVHRRRRRLHVQLHRQERDVRVQHRDRRYRAVARRRPADGADRLQRAQGRPAPHLDSDPARGTSGRTCRRRRPRGTREQDAHRRDGTLPVRGVQEGRLRAHGREPGVLPRRPAHRRDRLPDVPEPRHDDRRPRGRHYRRGTGRPAGAVRQGLADAGTSGRRLQLPQLGLPVHELLRGAPRRRVRRCCATSASGGR